MVFASMIQNTPMWVFVLFALLLVLGFQSLKPRTLPLWRLLIVPVVFIGWGSYGAAIRSGDPELVVFWFAALALSAVVSWWLTPMDDLQPGPTIGSVRVTGSLVPLTRNMAIFWTKYLLAVAIAAHAFDQSSLYEIDVVISGLSAGYFVGWGGRLALRYYGVAQDERI
ncbi:hypothetical protein JQ612_09850 [Bradyrhizobium manausense]|uniref:DUF6622 family protein n=1 Tax=Bradyrhizobium manausense TaxID=989370 RepID=UPI001BA71065|nr:DUF6622 family protein [Bradyrhizobium manausense]MBR0833496.1 hypothetical protein [Bradyrhizobium manausense]